jgi:hypothetical protein
MSITRTSPVSGITRTMELDVTPEQMSLFESRAATIQDIFPNLNQDEREFIKTGVTSDEWDSLFAP